MSLNYIYFSKYSSDMLKPIFEVKTGDF